MPGSDVEMWKSKGVYVVGLFLMIVSSVIPWMVCTLATRFTVDLMVVAGLFSFAGVISAFFILVEGVRSGKVWVRAVALGIPLACCLLESGIAGMVFVHG